MDQIQVPWTAKGVEKSLIECIMLLASAIGEKIGGYTMYLYKHHTFNKPLKWSSWSNYSTQGHVPLQGRHVRAAAYLNFPFWGAICACRLSHSRLKVGLHLPIEGCYATSGYHCKWKSAKWSHNFTSQLPWKQGLQKQFPAMILGSFEFGVVLWNQLPAVSRFAELLSSACSQDSVSWSVNYKIRFGGITVDTGHVFSKPPMKLFL